MKGKKQRQQKLRGRSENWVPHGRCCLRGCRLFGPEFRPPRTGRSCTKCPWRWWGDARCWNPARRSRNAPTSPLLCSVASSPKRCWNDPRCVDPATALCWCASPPCASMLFLHFPGAVPISQLLLPLLLLLLLILVLVQQQVLLETVWSSLSTIWAVATKLSTEAAAPTPWKLDHDDSSCFPICHTKKKSPWILLSTTYNCNTKQKRSMREIQKSKMGKLKVGWVGGWGGRWKWTLIYHQTWDSSLRFL